MKLGLMIDSRRSIQEPTVARRQQLVRGNNNFIHASLYEGKSNFTPLENLLIEWSVSTVGQSWNVIADILRSHPLASGQNRDFQSVQEQYAYLQMKNEKPFHRVIRLDPIANECIPILGRFKTYLLTNKINPVYTQRHILRQTLDKEESKLSGKRKRDKNDSLIGYEPRELKYKCIDQNSPFRLLFKSNQNSSTGNEGERQNVPLNNRIEEGKIVMPIHVIAKEMTKQRNTSRDYELKKLLYFRPDRVERHEINLDQMNSRNNESLANCKLNLPNILENISVHSQDIFKYNWTTMTNTWYQNHRNLAHHARKMPLDAIKMERPDITSTRLDLTQSHPTMPCILKCNSSFNLYWSKTFGW